MAGESLNPRESGRFIAEHSRDVKILPEGVEKFSTHMAGVLKEGGFSLQNWKDQELNPQSSDKAAADFVFVMDTLNFSFWSEEPSARCKVEFKGKKYTGYFSLLAAMNKALEEGIPITDPAYYSKISLSELQQVLRCESTQPMPMMEERLKNLHETGTVLVQKYGGSFVNCIKEAEGSAQRLLQLIVTEFPCYRDQATFNGKTVSLYKRAQIVVADLWSCYQGQGLGEFKDISSITMFADYRIPQVLNYFGVLQYSDALMERLNKGDLFVSGERQEVELRGCSIWAIELIAEAVKKLLKGDPVGEKTMVNSILIDNYIWDYRRSHVKDVDTIPMHRIRCIYY